jgi:hypothetical protein
MVFPNLIDKVLFNKTGKRVSRTCMEEALMPQEYGMELTSHKALISFMGSKCFLFCFEFYFILFYFIFVIFCLL